MNLNSTESNGMLKFNYRDLMIFILPILIFSLYLFMYNPGVLTAASFSQLHQIATGQFTTSSPILHTLLVMLFVKIFKTPLFIGAFQIIIFAAIWMIICKYHRDDSTNNNQYIVQFILTLIICLIPINAVYSVTLSSNVLFSYSMLFLSFLIKVMLDKNGEINNKLIILMALTIAIMSGLNSYGIIIAIPCLIAIAYYLLSRNVSRNTIVSFVGITVVLLLFVGSLNFIFDVQQDTTNIQTNDAFEEDINLENAKAQFFSAVNDKPTEEYESVSQVNIRHGNYGSVSSYVSMFKENFILDGLFNNPILYMIFSIALLVLITLIVKSKDMCLIYVAPFINSITMLIIEQNNLYSNLLVFYLIVIIFISICFNLNLKPNDFNSLLRAKSTPKKAEPQPAVNAEPDYVEDNYYSDLESELEDLSIEDINEMLGKDIQREDEIQIENPQKEVQEESSSDLLDEILKEIEMEKKD
ncbi:MAG: hypothetical protein IJL02_00540 [Methanobrevibacter sp.]|uniref:hypothetical protein n=1 Tax=Methanobrevibacter sp. TaxID=66852 RepID=UPI0025D18FE6|nr:hypothetical protein [Methanobrevibacter sp.]MBQ6098334.1 hypothetical protein [Methanobrevibacter sp.]